MKGVFLSVIIVSALIIAGISGTLATWSDSETSAGNTITTGSVDLKVNNQQDAPWGSGVPAAVNIQAMVPGKVYGPFEINLWNAGISDFASHSYIKIKDIVCSNAPPRDGSGYQDPHTGDMKPKPELVAEYGGQIDGKTVPGVGVMGDNGTLSNYIYMWLIPDDPNNRPVYGQPNSAALVQGCLGTIKDQRFQLIDLNPGQHRSFWLWFFLKPDSEEQHNLNIFPNIGETGYDELTWKMFNDWPSWALMSDRVQFNMEFDLWLENPA